MCLAPYNKTRKRLHATTKNNGPLLNLPFVQDKIDNAVARYSNAAMLSRLDNIFD